MNDIPEADREKTRQTLLQLQKNIKGRLIVFMKSNKPKLWTKDFITISSANFFIFLTFYLLMVTLTVYTMDQFHTSQSLAGLASSIFVLGAVLIRPIAGKTIDSIGMKKDAIDFVNFIFNSKCSLFSSK